MQNNADYYYVPTGLDMTMVSHIVGLFDEDSLEDGKLGKGVSDSLRKSKISWISYNHWISGIMAHYVREANEKFFKYDLTAWAADIQYTTYNQKGSHYGWHCDNGDKNLLNGCETRKLSISLLLSDPDEYEGGEFQLQLCGRTDMITLKPPLGYAIIFPSTSVHRVRPIKSGVRTSLVGWYGGPNFR